LLTSASSWPSWAIVPSTNALADASIADVGGDRDRAPAGVVDPGRQRLDAIGAPRRQRHRGAGLCRGERRRLADAR
jgi:hypothetical protein